MKERKMATEVRIKTALTEERSEERQGRVGRRVFQDKGNQVSSKSGGGDDAAHSSARGSKGSSAFRASYLPPYALRTCLPPPRNPFLKHLPFLFLPPRLKLATFPVPLCLPWSWLLAPFCQFMLLLLPISLLQEVFPDNPLLLCWFVSVFAVPLSNYDVYSGIFP